MSRPSSAAETPVLVIAGEAASSKDAASPANTTTGVSAADDGLDI